METIQMMEVPVPEVCLAEAPMRREPKRMVDFEMLKGMSLEELLYYVLVGDGAKLG